RVGQQRNRQKLAHVAARLIGPKPLIAESGRALTSTSRSLAVAKNNYFRVRESDLRRAGALLESYSFKGVLERGFALIKDSQNRLMDSVSLLKPGMNVTLELKDGTAGAAITGLGSSKQTREKPAVKKPGKKTGGEQGTLL
ncbi:MAG: hypothetical protein RIB59_11590, partial [Rhodospirillales bacterium]